MIQKRMPTTNEVKNAWVSNCWEFTNAISVTDYEEQFDRWLAAHDAEVYQRGREDASKAVGELCSSNKKDENGWYLFDHCYECRGVAAGYDLAVADAVAAARGDGEQA